MFSDKNSLLQHSPFELCKKYCHGLKYVSLLFIINLQKTIQGNIGWNVVYASINVQSPIVYLIYSPCVTNYSEHCPMDVISFFIYLNNIY